MCIEMKAYFKTLEDLVLTEEKIITYKWLSKKLSVHTNTSKQILYSFYKKNESKDIVVTYMVSGFPKDGTGLKVSLVRGDELTSARETFTKVISEHVYSIHKSSDLENCLNALCLTDRILDPATRLSSIVPREVPQRQVRAVVTEPQKTSKPEPKTVAAKPVHKSPSKKETSVKSKSPSPVKVVSKVSPKKPTKKLNSVVAAKGGIGALFKKQEEKSAQSNTKPKQTSKIETTRKEQSPQPQGSRQEAIHKDHIDSDDKQKSNKLEESVKVDQGKRKKQAEKKTAGGSGNKRKKASGSSAATKKRRRINVISDSESDESEEEEEMEEEPEPEPVRPVEESDEEVIPPTPHGKQVGRLVNKTYTDDDGFIVTRKEFVYESCDEDEEESQEAKKKKKNENEKEENEEKKKETSIADSESSVTSSKASKTPPNKQKPNKKPAQNKNSPQQNKQQSIMSFFKKK